MKKLAFLTTVFFATLRTRSNIVKFKLMEGLKFWGGCVTDERAMP